MNAPTPKELKKLADACRKAGISKFKCGDLEFELAPDAPESAYKRKQTAAKPHEEQGDVSLDAGAWDSFTPEQQLLYSAVPGGHAIEVQD